MSTKNIVSQSPNFGLTRRQVLKVLAILPIASLSTVEAPNAWVASQAWRTICPITESTSKVNAVRLRLWDLDIYPTGEELEENPAHVANLKAALHQIIEELNPADLDSTYRLARLYALFPDTEGKVWAKQDEGWLGFDKVIELTREEPSKKEYLDKMQTVLDTLGPSEFSTQAQTVLDGLR